MHQKSQRVNLKKERKKERKKNDSEVAATDSWCGFFF
jgi:hypothetical protein